MEQYYWFILGTIFGLAIAVYFFVSREEKIEKSIKLNQKVFMQDLLRMKAWKLLNGVLQNVLLEVLKWTIRYTQSMVVIGIK